MGNCASIEGSATTTTTRHRNSNGSSGTSSKEEGDCKGALSDYILNLRRTEYHRLDKTNNVYLDYTGAGLYPESVVRAHTQALLDNVYGNPHSSNPTSQLATEAVETAREDVLKFFNADPEEYACIFTLNASGALRLVGESYPFRQGGAYLLFIDNHNSVNGIAEFARQKGAEVHCVDTTATLRVDEDNLENLLEEAGGTQASTTTNGKLFAFPAQSNFSGVKHSLSWIQTAQNLGWDVLLDAAAFVPTSPLDLSEVKPEFVSMSFYKIFGYPTGVGALIAKKSALSRLERPWFAGGTVSFVEVKHGFHKKSGTIHEAFEDGTLNFLSIPALSLGLKFMNSVPGGMHTISNHVKALTWRLMDGMRRISHTTTSNNSNTENSSNNEATLRPVISFVGPRSNIHRGGTVAFIILDSNGENVCAAMVEALANSEGISVRSGCFCNPGASSAVFAKQWIKIESLLHNNKQKPPAENVQEARFFLLNFAAAIRVSVGMATSFNDIDRLCRFLESNFVNKTYAEVAAKAAMLSEKCSGKGIALCRSAAAGAPAGGGSFAVGDGNDTSTSSACSPKVVSNPLLVKSNSTNCMKSETIVQDF